MRRFLTGRTSTSTSTKGAGTAGRNGGATRGSSWLLGAALLSIAVFFAIAPASGIAANAAANLDQCANGSDVATSSSGCNSSASDWVNGNLGSSKSAYREGDSIPYRLLLSNLAPGTHTVTIEWDTTKSGKHAIDYIDKYNQSVLDANPCLGVSGCSPGTFTTTGIPADPQVTGGGVTPIAGNFTLFGGTLTGVTRPSAVGSTACTPLPPADAPPGNSKGSYCYSSGLGFSGDKSAAITVQFTTTAANPNPVLAWGGHIATRKDWGFGNSAVAISGSPYHTRLIDLDGSGGNQDRSLSAAAVIFPGQITVIKNAVPDSSTSFPFTDSGAEMTPSSFSLVDDGTNTQNQRVFSNLLTFPSTRTVTETQPPPAHWTLTNLVCSIQAADPTSPGSTSTTLATGVATINLNEGDFATCTYTNTHQVASPSIATTLSASTGSIGDTVHDSSALTGATSDAGGTVTYTVYTNNTCSAGARDAGTKTVTNGIVPDSNGLVFNSAGTFYWQAVYSGDANNNGATSACTSEQLVIGPNSPSIATTLSASTGSIGDTVHDSSALTGATSDAGGTVTYTVYTNNTCSAGARDAGTKTVTNGIVPDSNGLVFNSAGTFYWQAVYSGDANNNGATSACTSEQLVIGPNSPSIATTLSASTGSIGDTVHDSSALTGATSDAGGTVTYTVYTNNTCSAGARDAGTKTVTNGIVPDSNGLVFNSAGTFYWQAVYSGDANNNGATSACTSEQLVIGPNSPSIATTLSASTGSIGDTVHDSSALTGATSDAGGTVTYTVYTNNTCSAGARDAGTKTVTNGIVPDSNGLVFNSAGTFYWQAVYSGDANNNGATSACTSEQLVIGPNSPSIATTLSASTGSIGDTVHDSSALTGATSDAGGTVTYTVYTNNTCSAGARDAGTKTVTNGIVPDSNGLVFNSAGTFYWQAVYSGDANNNGATSACTSEQLVIGPNSPSIATTLSASTGSIGDTVHDSSALTGATSDAGGTVTYTVYTNNTCSAGARDAGTKTVTNGIVPDSNGLVFNSAGTFYWQAVYSGDANNNGATSACTSEQLVIGPNSPSIATTLSASTGSIGDTVHDSSALTGATSDAGGTVTYTVYTNNTCSAGARDAGTKTVTNGIVPDSNGLVFNSAGTFYWQAVYSGDANNNGATSACTSEQLVIGPNSPSIATTLSASTGSIGDTVHDSSALTGATSDAGGTVTYTVYTNNTCSAGARDAGTKTVTNGIVPDSNGLVFNSAGTFYWQAVYSGDANNNGATSACTSEQLVIGPNSPSIATTLSASTGSIGDTVHDSSALTGATSDAGGTVTYTVYTNNTCSAGARDAGTKTVTNGIVPDSNGLVFNSAGTFYWQAVYSGDANNNGATSACTSEQLVITNPNVSQITPTATTCQQFKNGTAATLGQIQYSLKGPASSATINQVNPGVLFYWVKVSGATSYTITQTIGPLGETLQTPFGLASGSFAYDANCNTINSATVTQNNAGSITVTGTGIAFIGIKLDPGTVVGKPAPNPTTAIYTFATTGIAGSTSSVNLVKK